MKRTATATKTATKSGTTRNVWNGAHKWFTGIMTTIAAVMTLMLNAKTLGLSPWLGLLDPSLADIAARRVVLMPRADTLRSLGDTASIVATVIDARGAILVGASLRWKSSDTTVATVDSGGTIIARAPGRATIEASVRDVVASAPLLVRQHPADVMLLSDSTLRMADGDSLLLTAQVVDARRQPVRALAPRWHSSDSLVVRTDSLGAIVALRPGRAVLIASAGDLQARVAVDVVLTPAVIALQRGAGQRALAGRPLTEPVVLQVLTRAGQPVPGTVISIGTENGEGTISPASATTDAAGRVRAQWTLGTRAGVHRLFAHVATIDSTLTVLADADPSPGNIRVEALTAELAGIVAGETTEPARVRVTDSLGVALASVRIAWDALDGGAVVGAPQTDSTGLAEARWTLGKLAGAQRLRVQVGNARYIPATTLKAKAEHGVASEVVVRAGDKQSTTVGGKLAKPVVIAVRDSLGNGIAGAQLRVAAKGGVASDTLLTTGADGRATVSWTLGDTAGTQRLEVRLAPGTARTVVSATARAGKASAVALVARKSGTGGAQRLTAQVTDEHGNVVRHAQLVFSAAAGKLSKLRVTSDSLGRAVVTWTPPATKAPAKTPVKVAVSIAGTKSSVELQLR